jgi:hypothetical protein
MDIMGDGFINLDNMNDDILYERIKEYENHRNQGYYYCHDFKCKLSLDIEGGKGLYILDEDQPKTFETVFYIEQRLYRVFYHLRLGDWKTALFHIGQLKPDEHLKQPTIDVIAEDINRYITTNYGSNNTIDDIKYLIDKHNYGSTNR